MWLKIENLPDYYKTKPTMFVVKAFDVLPMQNSIYKYTSDPYCVWLENGEYVRWPHPFPPTHYLELPVEKE